MGSLIAVKGISYHATPDKRWHKNVRKEGVTLYTLRRRREDENQNAKEAKPTLTGW